MPLHHHVSEPQKPSKQFGIEEYVIGKIAISSGYSKRAASIRCTQCDPLALLQRSEDAVHRTQWLVLVQMLNDFWAGYQTELSAINIKKHERILLNYP